MTPSIARLDVQRWVRSRARSTTTRDRDRARSSAAAARDEAARVDDWAGHAWLLGIGLLSIRFGAECPNIAHEKVEIFSAAFQNASTRGEAIGRRTSTRRLIGRFFTQP